MLYIHIHVYIFYSFMCYFNVIFHLNLPTILISFDLFPSYISELSLGIMFLHYSSDTCLEILI